MTKLCANCDLPETEVGEIAVRELSNFTEREICVTCSDSIAHQHRDLIPYTPKWLARERRNMIYDRRNGVLN